MSDQRTALVLGGGGITGIAWEIGVLAGLAEAGVDLTGADLVVGTSAGSVVGAQLTCGAELETLYERQLEPPTEEKAARHEPRDAGPVRLGDAPQPAATTQSSAAGSGRSRSPRRRPARRRRSRSGSTSSARGWSAPSGPSGRC